LRRNVEIKLRNLAEAVAKANFNPNEPRVPVGNRDGGQWTTVGAGAGQPSSDSRPGSEAAGSSNHHVVVMSDALPDPLKPGARYAQPQSPITPRRAYLRSMKRRMC
jgi:hypothetical protein